MSKFNLDDLIKRLGPEVLPFERDNDPTKKPASEEVIDLSSFAYDAINDEPPEPRSHHMTVQEIEKLPKGKMYIWLVYFKNGELNFRIINDNFENKVGIAKVGGRRNVCHSNISAGEKALQGGECWWCDETKTMYINYKSGRYGAKTQEQWNAVQDFFKHVGYENVQPIIPVGWELKS
jgi:hypothetical protein